MHEHRALSPRQRCVGFPETDGLHPWALKLKDDVEAHGKASMKSSVSLLNTYF